MPHPFFRNHAADRQYQGNGIISLSSGHCRVAVAWREREFRQSNAVIDEINPAPIPRRDETPQILDIVARAREDEARVRNPAAHHYLASQVEVLGMGGEAIGNVAHYAHQAPDRARCVGEARMKWMALMLTALHIPLYAPHKFFPHAHSPLRP